MNGLRGLIIGLANDHSIAWGCARVAHEQGARLVLTCLNGKARAHVEPLATEEVLDVPATLAARVRVLGS
ncbi:MAG: SDR family oxidoreductase, partial [Rhizobacter sp.]